MTKGDVVFVRCEFARGGFPSELVFHVKAPDGGTFAGTSPIEYCYRKDKTSFRGELKRGERESGYVIGLVLGPGEGKGTQVVQLPDGDVYEINDGLIEQKEGPVGVPL